MEHKEFESLKAEHGSLKSQIEEEYARPTPDDTHIGELKRKKLQIKDLIATIESEKN